MVRQNKINSTYYLTKEDMAKFRKKCQKLKVQMTTIVEKLIKNWIRSE